MEEALVAYLLANAGLTALVGDRINWSTRPQGSIVPALALTKVGGVRGYTMRGPDGLIEARVQVDCWGRTFGEAKRASRAVIAAMHGIKGVHGGVRFQSAFVDGERDGFDSGSNVQTGSAERLFRTSLDFIIWHNSGE